MRNTIKITISSIRNSISYILMPVVRSFFMLFTIPNFSRKTELMNSDRNLVFSLAISQFFYIFLSLYLFLNSSSFIFRLHHISISKAIWPQKQTKKCWVSVLLMGFFAVLLKPQCLIALNLLCNYDIIKKKRIFCHLQR